jgi:hypothetical protein
MAYDGPYTSGPQARTARIPLKVASPQGGGKLDEENPMKLKANQSVELILHGSGLTAKRFRIGLDWHPSLHEAGVVRAPAILDVGDTLRAYYTTRSSIDLAELPWIVKAWLIPEV